MTSLKRPQLHALRWPAGWSRTASPKPASFDGDRTLTKASAVLLHNLSTSGSGKPFANDVVITVADGTPYPKRDVDPGAAVYFMRAGLPYVLASDLWDDARHNVWALALHVNALRSLERWGVGSTSQAFAGYAALPPSSGPQNPDARTTFTSILQDDSDTSEAWSWQEPAMRYLENAGYPWRLVLGFSARSRPTVESVQAAYETLARKWHPDRPGGSTTIMQRINVARDQAMRFYEMKGWKP